MIMHGWFLLKIIDYYLWTIIMNLSPGLNCFQRFFLEKLNIYCTSTFAQSYQALTNNSPNKGQLQDIRNFHFLSSPPKKG